MAGKIETLRHRLSHAGPRLRQGIILAGLMLALPVVGMLIASRVSLNFVLPVILAPILFGIAANRLQWSVVGIFFTAAFVRFTLPSGTHSRIVASLLFTALLVVIWVSRMMLAGRVQLRSSPAHKPLIAFILVSIISYIWGIAFRDPLLTVWDTWGFVQLGALAVMVLLPCAFLLASEWLGDLRLLRWLVRLTLLVGGLTLLDQYTSLPLGWVQSRPLFPLWFASLGLGQALYNRQLSNSHRAVILGLVSAWTLYTLSEWLGWVSAWLPTFLAMGYIALRRSRLFFALLIVLALIFVMLNWTEVTMLYHEQRIESGETRVDAWINSMQVLRGHFIFGVGPAGYAAYYMYYYPEEAMATHNNYLDILLQAGVVGLAVFALFLGALGYIAIDLLHRIRGRGDFIEAFGTGAAGGLLGTVVAMGLGDWVIPFVYTQTIEGYDYAVYTWLFLGAMAALHRMITKGEIEIEKMKEWVGID
ncbi:MAG: O-antigen ligase family protein [Anaerolineae bacterium]